MASSIFLKIYDNDKEKKMAVFTGAGVALVTPMNEDGSVNFEKLAEVLEEQIAQMRLLAVVQQVKQLH